MIVVYADAVDVVGHEDDLRGHAERPQPQQSLDTLQRGVQWMGGAVDGGSII